MNDFDYLKMLKQKCLNQDEHIHELRLSLDGLKGITYDKEKVQSSLDGDPMLQKFCKLDEEEQKLNKYVADWIKHRIKIAQKINLMEIGKRQSLLRMHYLDEKSLEICCCDLEWSVEYAKKELRNAVKDYENIPKLSG